MEISSVLDEFPGKKILVIGDVMLDHYVWGKVERISPEAPVPVLQAVSEEYRLGGAANVALNLRALGAEVLLFGICGDDAVALTLRSELQAAGISDLHIFRDETRRTTLKTRMSSVNQQVLRIDYEDIRDISSALEAEIAAKLAEAIPEVDGIIIEDYNKGLLTQTLIRETIRIAGTRQIPVAVDPKQKNFFAYTGVDIFKPNYQEMQKNLGLNFESEAEFELHAKELRERMNCRFLVVTRGSRGLYIFGEEPAPQHIPTFAREVYDVSGAGDTVISTMMLAYCSGSGIFEAATVANHAAGVVCGKQGTASVSPAEILRSIESFDHDRK